MPSTKPSTKKKSSTDAAATTAAAPAEAVDRVDLLDSLQIGDPALDPVPCALRGVEFSINRYYSPSTIWRWSDLLRRDVSELKPTEIDAQNRELLGILIPADEHDKIDEVLSVIADRSIPEARRIYQYMNNLAGLVDRQGNPLAL